MSQQLKHEIYVLANMLAPGEAMMKLDAEISLHDAVARICTMPNANSLMIAMIAITLADHIDKGNA